MVDITQKLFKKIGLIVVCLLVYVNPVQAELTKKEMAKLQTSLRETAQKFGEAYVKRDYKTMYDLLNREYRHRVELWEYKDYVHYEGVSDGFIKVDIMDVIVFPLKKGKKVIYGKVSQKVSTVENIKTKTTGYTDKLEEEFIYWDDWVSQDGVWRKVEKLE